MNRSLRKTLNLIIAFTMAVPSMGLAHPSTPPSPITPQMQNSADIYGTQFANLEQAGAGQVKGSLPPDRFLLMEQSVFRREIPVVRTFLGHTFRKWRLEALHRKVAAFAVRLPDSSAELNTDELVHFAKALLPIYANMKWMRNEHPINKEVLEAITHISSSGTLADALLPLLSLDGEKLVETQAIADGEQRLDATVTLMLTGLTNDHLTNGRRSDTPLFIWDSQKSSGRLTRIARVLTAFQERWSSNERLQVANPTESPYERKTRAINWWDTSVQIQDNDKVLQTLNMRDTAAGVDSSQSQPFFCAQEKCRFNIVKDKTVLHSFGIPSKVVATFNEFVVFTHADGYDAETGTQYLLFMDMKTYSGLIGNEDLPIFRLPLKIDQPVRSMDIRDGRLTLNGQFGVDASFFKQASEMQQVAFNLQANLLSPDSWAKVLPLVDSVQEFFSKSVHNELQEAQNKQTGMKSATVLMERLGTELQAHLDAQKQLKPLNADEKADLKAITSAPAILENGQVDQAIASLKLYHQRVSQSEVLGQIMHESQERLRISRKLTARVRLLGSAWVSPRPFASQKIKEALGAWYVRHPGKDGVMERLLRLTDRPYVNAGVIGAGIMAAVAPDSFHSMVNLGLSAGTSIVDYITFALGGMGEASVEGTKATGAFFTDISTIPEQYFNDGAWMRTLVAIPTYIGFLAGLYFTGHFAFNLAQLFRDLKKPGINGFVDRQQKFKEEYYANLAKDEASHRNFGSEVTFTPEEDAQIRQWTDVRRAEFRKGGVFARMGNAIKNTFNKIVDTAVAPMRSLIDASMESQNEDILNAMVRAETSPAVQKGLTDSKEDHHTFWTAFMRTAAGKALGDASGSVTKFIGKYGGAVKDLTFSLPALELTLSRWVHVWNEWAMWRTAVFGWAKVRVLGSDIPVFIKVRPLSFAAKLLYPEFQKTVGMRRTGQRVLPTELNGGLRSRFGTMWDKVSKYNASGISDSSLQTDPDTSAELLHLPGNWNPQLQLQALEKFEDQIIDVEKEISEVAFRKSLEALSDYMTDKKDLKILFNAKGITNIVEPDIRELSWKSQTFVRAHYDSAYTAAMTKYLNEEVERREAASNVESVVELDAAPTPIPVEAQTEVDQTQQDAQDSLIDLKNHLARLNVSPDGVVHDYGFDLLSARSAALAVAGDQSHIEAAKVAVAKGRLSPSNFIRNTKFGLIADYDPTQNKTMKRVEEVHRRLQSPSAMGRAVRAELVKLVLTVPIELTARLIFTAGIFEGAMKPLQEHFWGPNSVFFLSETSFMMIFASGFVMSMMADAWLKVQQDARQDEAGEFGAIPVGEDAEKSFLRWYLKQFNEEENSLMKNWKQANSLAFWNMPAAIPNILLFWAMFSGRFDLSLLLAGYVLSFGTPLSAIHYKVDQAFERAVHFAARGIKEEKWMAHPEVQKLLVPEMQKSRFRFSIYNDLWNTIQGDWLNNVEFIPTSLGTRGFQRAMFGGGLLEEYIIKGALRPIQHAVTGIPVLEHVVKPLAKGCEFLLSNGNTDLKLGK
ncbi:MAG: hypothetical protein KF799_07815 [Bdellovibrionales bacterium]|nr:hypothetical protein [Bdellovibrionales bacterium]